MFCIRPILNWRRCPAGRLKKKYNISGEPRAELYADAERWVAALGDRPFMGGEAPNLADLSVFGVVRSITGTDTFMDLLHNTGISKWCVLPHVLEPLVCFIQRDVQELCCCLSPLHLLRGAGTGSGQNPPQISTCAA
jgi:hypothetical protein